MSVLAILAGIYSVQQFLASTPREPRILFQNKGASDIDRLIVEIGPLKSDLGRVKAGATIILPIKLRAEEGYLIHENEFSGEELINCMEVARQNRADLRIGVDNHGCGWLEDEGVGHADGFPTKRSARWFRFTRPGPPRYTGSVFLRMIR